MAITGTTELGNGLLVLTVDADPRVTAVDAPSGSVIVFVGTDAATIRNGDTFRKLDDGSTTNVSESSLKNSLSETTDPGVSDDNTQDYQIGSVWINTTGAGKAFICLDAATGAAVWTEITSAGATDADAVHVNVAGEIAGIVEKVSPVAADLVIIEDSADGNNKKKAQLGNLPGGGAGGGVPLGNGWAFSTTITDADPGAGNFRLNNAVQASATFIFISDISENGTDLSKILLNLADGDQIYIQETGDSTRFHLVEVGVGVVDAVGYVKIPITFLDSGADLTDAAACSLIIVRTLPVPDTVGIAHGSVDATKIVRFEVDGLTTGVTRVITMPDEDVTLVTVTKVMLLDGTQAMTGTMTTQVVVPDASGTRDLGLVGTVYRRTFTNFIRPAGGTALDFEDEGGDVALRIDTSGNGRFFANLETNTNLGFNIGTSSFAWDRIVVRRHQPGTGNDLILETGAGVVKLTLVDATGNVTISPTSTLTVSGNIEPEANATRDLGNATALAYQTLFVRNIRAEDSGDFNIFFVNGNPALTFNAAATLVVYNENGLDADWRWEGDNDPVTLTVDAGNDSVGVGVALGSHTAKFNIQQDGTTTVAMFIDQNANANSILFDIESTTANVIEFGTPLTTGGILLNCNTANSLTTGGFINFRSGSPAGNVRELVKIDNANLNATATTVLEIIQAAANRAVLITVTADAVAIEMNLGTQDAGYFDFVGTADADVTSSISTFGVSGPVTHHIQMNLNGVKFWVPGSTTNPTVGTAAFVRVDGSTPLTAAWDVGGQIIQGINALRPEGTTGSKSIGTTTNAWKEIFVRNVRADDGQSLLINRSDGTTWATVTTAGNTTLGTNTGMASDITWFYGSGLDVQMVWDTAQIPDAFLVGLSGSNTFIITATGRAGTDLGIAGAATPTLVIHDGSATGANHGTLTHTGTFFDIQSTTGNMRLISPSGQVNLEVRDSSMLWRRSVAIDGPNLRDIGTTSDALRRLFTRFIQADNSFTSLGIEDGSGTTVISVADASTLTFSPTGNIVHTSVLQSDITAGITASATQTQAGGTALTSNINQISTVTTTNDAVTLMNAVAGIQVVIENNGVNTVQIFPALGDAIDGGAVNASITLTAGGNLRLYTIDGTNWSSIGAAAAGSFVTTDGLTPLTGNWDAGVGRTILVDTIRARTFENLRLVNDAGGAVIIISDTSLTITEKIEFDTDTHDIGSTTFQAQTVFTGIVRSRTGSLLIQDSSGTAAITIANAGDITFQPTGNVVVNTNLVTQEVRPDGDGTRSLGTSSNVYGTTWTRVVRPDAGNSLTVLRGNGATWLTLTNAGNATFGVNTGMADDFVFFWGDAFDATMRWDTSQLSDALLLKPGAARTFILSGTGSTPDLGLGVQNTPIMVYHDGGAVAGDWGSITHDGTDFVINANAGGVKIEEGGTTRITVFSTGEVRIDPTTTLTVSGNIIPEADGTRSLGVSGAVYGTTWTRVVRPDSGSDLTVISGNSQDAFNVQTGTMVINPNGNDRDFTVGGSTDPNLGFFNAGVDRFGVGVDPVAIDAKFVVEGTVKLKEQAAAQALTAAYGQVWVKNDTPNKLFFTDDAGTDFDLTAGGDPSSTLVEASGDITHGGTASTDIVATSMTITPASGTYLVWFSGSVDHDTNNANIELSIFSAGSKVAGSERRMQRGGSQGAVTVPFCCEAKVTVNGSQAIEGRWRTSILESTMHERTLKIIKVA